MSTLVRDSIRRLRDVSGLLAAVVVGRPSLFGGRGRLRGMLGGVVLPGMISNIFNLVGIDVW